VIAHLGSIAPEYDWPEDPRLRRFDLPSSQTIRRRRSGGAAAR
jgi:hypothetical protein